jgi:hypothetical protein
VRGAEPDSQSETSTEPLESNRFKPADVLTSQVPQILFAEEFSLGVKRPRSRSSSPNEHPPKVTYRCCSLQIYLILRQVLCIYPGQSIWDQSIWSEGSDLGAPSLPATTSHSPTEPGDDATSILFPLATMGLEGVISQYG